MIRRLAARTGAVPVVVGVVLLVVYGLTLARDTTFWDAGEFIASASDFGIPHPPGTPLYVMLLRSALLVLGAVGVPAAVATTLVSAGATAMACALGAAMLARATGDRAAGVAGGVIAGAMSSVWLNATETEVYAASLALAVLVAWAAERASRLRSKNGTLLVLYLLLLTVPLHLSALLAAPAAVYLATWRGGGVPRERSDYGRGLVAAAGAVGAWAVARVSLAGIFVGAVLALAGAWMLAHPARPRVVRFVAPVLLGALAASALLVMLVRAGHDPSVNQGNPATWAALLDVVSRKQYAVADLWPRQAPLWLQLGNLGLWADWQVALALGPTIFPTTGRTAVTIAFVVLGVVGGVRHFRADRRTATGFLLLLAAGSIGAALYLNLKAGPSFGWGILPDDAPREARERDYFFVLAWWAWGLWAGMGAVAAARAARLPGKAGIAAALVPLVLNWRSVDRTKLPEAALPRAIAVGLLEWSPPGAVLFVAGDNDSYPLWYAQRSLGLRRDVTVVTTPLLPARWYRQELRRRHGLMSHVTADATGWSGRHALLREMAAHARRQGRPVAFAVSMAAADRAALGGEWLLRGPLYVADAEEGGGSGAALAVDTAASQRWSARRDSLLGRRGPAPATDGVSRYVWGLLECPDLAFAALRGAPLDARGDSLAQVCNFK